MQIQIKGVSGGKDKRGLVTLTYKFLFIDSSEEDALFASLPIRINLPEGPRKITEWINNTSFIVDVTFEGVVQDPSETQEQYQIGGEWREEPIESFPYRDLLISKYGAYEEDGRLKFPQYLESSSSSGSGLGGIEQQEKENPLYGLTSYPVMRLVATRTYVRRVVPSSVFEKVGDVIKSLPGDFSNPPKRTWMVDIPLVRSKGNAWEIAEKYKEIDDLKHLEALYLLIKSRNKKK